MRIKPTNIWYFICLLAYLSVSGGFSDLGILNISGLKTEYLSNPLGVDDANPEFSWVLNSENRGAIQTAYQIIVSKNKKVAEKGRGEKWDTGKVNSGQSVNVSYEGKPLESGMKYYWRARVWDNDGEASPWSDVHTFQTGILNEKEWTAKWISHPDTAVSAPILRKEFNIEQEVESAHVYVTGVGNYEFYLNGKKVGDHVLDPGVTDHRRKVLYETFEVEDLLTKGRNAVGLMLGDGPFRIVEREERYAWRHHSFGGPRGLVQLHVRYSDGTEEVVTSDHTWKASRSPITYTSLFGGEEYDARLEQKGWDSPGFDDSAWKSVEVIDQYRATLDSQLMPPIRVIQTIEPEVKTESEKGIYIFDLKQNISGWWHIRVKGERGVRIKIRGAETLNDSLFPAPLKPGDRLSTKHEYHKNVWTTYTLKGEGIESYEPRFFYTGFRYIEARVDKPEQLESLEIVGRVVHSDLKRNGHFSSSDSLLNRIYRATVWSQRGNLHSVPTDCPHREKGAYNGDGQVIAEASIHDFQMQPFYKKWLRDMRDAQQENGRIPNTSPTVIGGGGGGVPWGSAYILIPWWMYQYYGDTEILKEHYSTMKSYLEYLENLAQNDSNPEEIYIINEFGSYWTSLGEWESPHERNDPNQPVVSTYYWYLNSRTFAGVAGILGNLEDQERFEALADSIKRASVTKFFDPDTNLYGWKKPYQTYLLFALAADHVPEGHEEGVLNRLIDDIMINRRGHLATGILGTKHLFKVLSDYGREDVIHSVVSKTDFPGWGFWIEKGATTLWENWEGKNSHNHQMFGSVNEYFYKYLAGIRAPTDRGTSTGYKKIHIRPYVPEGLERAEASLKTVRGLVVSRWERRRDGLAMEVSLPANTSGRISIPVPEFGQTAITESGKKVWDQDQYLGGVEGIVGGIHEDNHVNFDLKAGDYKFILSTFN